MAGPQGTRPGVATRPKGSVPVPESGGPGWLAALTAVVPGAVVTDPLVIAGYRHDEAGTVAFGTPAAVLLPRNVKEVQQQLALAAEHRVPVVPRGAGSGLSGGANAIDGGLVLSLERMNRIQSIDADSLIAVVEPGVINAELSAAVAPFGLCYPPDPASREFSTLGGNIATNAGGLCCVKYGVTANYVLGLEVVLGDGSLLRIGRRTLKGVAGYDLTSLFVGSEGTLGVITQATLRLRPRPPAAATLLAFFPTLVAAGAAVADIRRRLVPSLLELMDSRVLEAVERWKHLDLDISAAAMVLAQSDAGGETGVAEVEMMKQCCDRHGASFSAHSVDALEVETFMAARKLAYPALQRQGTTLPDDVAVPCARIPDLIAAIQAIGDEFGVLIATLGHAGDGNMHPTIVFDADDHAASTAARRAFDAIIRAALELGGTVTAEHGVGVLKRDHLREEIGEPAMHLHHRIKDMLDPRGILNPGKVI